MKQDLAEFCSCSSLKLGGYSHFVSHFPEFVSLSRHQVLGIDPRFRPVILRALQQVLLTRPSNLQLLEDFSGTLDPDGVHYNILSGMNYVQDLHDQVVQLSQQPPPDPSIRYSYVFIGYVSHLSCWLSLMEVEIQIVSLGLD